MKKTISACSIYIFTWLLYNLQGVLYQSGGIISKALLFVLLLWSLIYVFKVNSKKAPVYFRGLNLLVILFSIYGIILIVSGKQLYITEFTKTFAPNTNYLKSVYSSLLPIYVFYYYAKHRQLREEHLRFWVIAFIATAILQFFRSQQLMLQMSNLTEATNNAGYLFLYIIPVLIVYRNKPIIQYLLLAICFTFILLSMKRGAIVIGVLSTFLFLLHSIRNSSKSKKVAVVALSGLFLFSAYLIVLTMLESSDYFISRIEATLEGDDSNRSLIYSRLITAFTQEASFGKMLLGRGANGTLEVGSNFAHNDWLEILTNQGIVGVVMYLVYWIFFMLTCKSQYITGNNKFCLYLILMICFSKTMFSMSYSALSIYITSVLGLSLANRINVDKS